jgi:tetratricopeptide (TPR) repeat protein
MLERLRILTYLGELNREEGQLDEAKAWFTKALTLAKTIDYKAAICGSYQNLSTIELLNDNLDLAIELLGKGLSIANEIKRSHTIADCNFLLGETFLKKNDRQKALAHFDTAASYYCELGIEDRARSAAEQVSLLRA